MFYTALFVNIIIYHGLWRNLLKHLFIKTSSFPIG
ncbi:uncharacterized protein Eint_060185 [Encephalitozoon intestinalis ATCC 50506]|uniref:Uncharacterized protein n=1 Tax=Encephalitozoon intestinalis (strain ATCC 50506) TaxID=876142 RepID=W8P995_ENCIT|nr:uncharacterized protein Eint_060185 [Encephalitozoon intestinalis ATCC 50506]AHL30112.1 hypothetical protein Eint_060185 [Encephalitozoon intestinalis ATCC 50506]UTX45359.1 hypothetical protein GPK93_06g09100 [Encephalitozoon intestinalis]